MRTLTLVVALSIPAFAQDAAPAAPDAAAFIAKLDETWKTRDNAESLKAQDEAIREGLKAFPANYDLLWRAARARWFTADGVTDEKQKRQVAKAGWDYAKRAVEAKPDGSEGHYYTAINIGAYSQAVPKSRATSRRRSSSA